MTHVGPGPARVTPARHAVVLRRRWTRAWRLEDFYAWVAALDTLGSEDLSEYSALVGGER